MDGSNDSVASSTPLPEDGLSTAAKATGETNSVEHKGLVTKAADEEGEVGTRAMEQMTEIGVTRKVIWEGLSGGLFRAVSQCHETTN